MTILQSLAKRYDRLASADEAPIPGFAPSQISFTIVLDRDGRYVATHDERTGEGKKLRPRLCSAPAAPKRTVGIASGALWDKTSYVLGRSAPDATASAAKQAKDAERLVKEHAAFVARHEKLLDGTEDSGCAALLAFLRQWSPDRYDTLQYAGEMLDQNVAFRLEGDSGFIHDRPAARAALIAEAGARDAVPEAMCLVTGAVAPIARLHPSIKGVPGAQSSGAALVSFNLDSFTSHGKEQGANAPVSEAAAFAYATALNLLLATSRNDPKTGRPIYPNRVMLGETAVAFWAEHDDAEYLARVLMGGAGVEADDDEERVDTGDDLPVDERGESQKLRDVLRRMEEGRPLKDVAPDMHPESRVYVLGLSPNAARLSVRFWVEQSLEAFARNFQLHWQDLSVAPKPHPWPPPLWRLLLELAPQRESKNIPPHLGGEMMRAILTGLPYPRALLIQTIMRIRADGDVNALRVALVKAVVTRIARRTHEALVRQNPDVPSWKDPLVALDRDENNVGYRLGRLFALLDYAQYLSVGSVNAGVKEKFFASASSTPRRIFPSILRMYQNHLSDARKSPETRDRANHTDLEIKQIMDGLEAHMPFPTTLSLDDQGRFIVGFYHQRPARRGAKGASAPASESESASESEKED
jgi:CRISPR-associated protein Csd1